MSDQIVYCRGVLCVVDAAIKWHAEKCRKRYKHDPEWTPTDAERRLYEVVSDLVCDLNTDRTRPEDRTRMRLPQLDA